MATDGIVEPVDIATNDLVGFLAGLEDCPPDERRDEHTPATSAAPRAPGRPAAARGGARHSTPPPLPRSPTASPRAPRCSPAAFAGAAPHAPSGLTRPRCSRSCPSRSRELA